MDFLDSIYLVCLFVFFSGLQVVRVESAIDVINTPEEAGLSICSRLNRHISKGCCGYSVRQVNQVSPVTGVKTGFVKKT